MPFDPKNPRASFTIADLAKMTPAEATEAARAIAFPPKPPAPAPTPAMQAMDERAQLARDMAAGEAEHPNTVAARAMREGGPDVAAKMIADKAREW